MTWANTPSLAALSLRAVAPAEVAPSPEALGRLIEDASRALERQGLGSLVVKWPRSQAETEQLVGSLVRLLQPHRPPDPPA